MSPGGATPLTVPARFWLRATTSRRPPRRAKIAYPISTFTYVILQPTDPLGNGGLLQQFVKYALGPGQAFGPALDFVPLPKNIKGADESAASRIH